MRALVFLFSILIATGCTTFDGTSPQVQRSIKDINYDSKREDGSPRKRLMVLPFLDESILKSQQLKDRARKEFIDDLNRTGDVVAFDSRELKIDLSKFMEKQEYKLPEIAKRTQSMGVSAVLEGRILDVRIQRKADNVGIVRNLSTVFEVVAQVRVVTGRTGRELFNTVKTVTVEEKGVRVGERVDADKFLSANPEMIESIVKGAFADFIPQVISSLEKIVWEGRIAAVNGDRIYLNVGRVSGVQIGDLLKVAEDGDDVYDPESGSHIGRVPGRLKGTLEVISYFGSDGSIAVIHSGSGFRENDRVEMY